MPCLDLSGVKPDPAWSFAHCKPSETTKWTHSYHRYPAKFIPQLVEKLFDEYLSADCGAARGRTPSVNDPFVGSGTTVVSALARGYQASGTDVNRLAFLMTLVKSTPLEPRYLEERLERFTRRLESMRPEERCPGSRPTTSVEPLIPQAHLERIDYWYPEQTKLMLGQMLRLIHEEEDESVHRFLLLAFSNILKGCSIWMQRSTKPTRDFAKTPDSPYLAMRRQLARMQRGNRAYYAVVPERVRRSLGEYLRLAIDDARRQPVADGSVDLVVTSSPYVTSYEYADLHQLSTIWLNLADDLAEYRRSFIGSACRLSCDSALASPTGRGIVQAMRRRSTRTAEEVEAFFADMQAVIAESYRILRPGGRACYVIGNTRLRGVDILNAEVLAEAMLSAGFGLDRIIKREIPSKILPQTRDARSGRFAPTLQADNHAYPHEYVVVGMK